MISVCCWLVGLVWVHGLIVVLPWSVPLWVWFQNSLASLPHIFSRLTLSICPTPPCCCPSLFKLPPPQHSKLCTAPSSWFRTLICDHPLKLSFHLSVSPSFCLVPPKTLFSIHFSYSPFIVFFVPCLHITPHNILCPLCLHVRQTRGGVVGETPRYVLCPAHYSSLCPLPP